jgi:hypothetical protein
MEPGKLNENTNEPSENHKKKMDLASMQVYNQRLNNTKKKKPTQYYINWWFRYINMHILNEGI